MIRSKDNPQLKERTMKDGRVSLFLEFYEGRKETPLLDEAGEPVRYTSGAMKGKPKYKVTHKRRQENLGLYYKAKPRTPTERWEKEEALRLARQIRWERQQEFLNDKEGYRLRRDRQGVNFLEYFQNYYDKYTKKDKPVMKTALQRFKDFLRDTPEYSGYKDSIRPSKIDKAMMVAFTEYLQGRSKGGGAHTIFAHFKKVILYAVDNGVMNKNPCYKVSIKIDNNQVKKDILSPEEIGRLAATKCSNPTVKRAFLFSLYTCLRWCDVEALTFNNVDYSSRLLRFEQKKTKGHSTASGVPIPLSNSIIKLIGKPQTPDGGSGLIFDLPSYDGSKRIVAQWVKKAGITKHITWHCARHSFAVNILNNGANIKTVSSLLGHSSLVHTEKYVRAVDELKRAAIESLPSLDLQDDGE